MLMLGRKPVSPLCMPYAGFEKATNCILEIPQNLKLEFSNGVLTVKAGSVLVNSGEPYSTITLTSDATLALSPQQNTDYMVFMYANSSFAARRISDQICSGNTDTLLGTPYHVWFDTSNKIIKSYGSNTSPEAYTQFRYPICVLKTNSSGNVWEGFAKDSNGNDIIFNGAGFVGHHAFVYPNPDLGLIGNGKNSEDNPVSIKVSNNALQIVDIGHQSSNAVIIRDNSTFYVSAYSEVNKYEDLQAVSGVQYVKDNNICYSYSDGVFNEQTRLKVIGYTYNGTTVTDFTIQQPLIKYRWVVKLIP